ncbi:MAG TPA: hypothetical protein VFI47_26485 [Acidimicrobiales bacterium]|nr:hypothetical protein [Acidimicrobiales bacterium]
MAFLRLAFFPGGTAEQWAAVAGAVGDVSSPEGRRAFAAGPVEDGWQVMQLWDSREGLEGFNREVFFPAVAGLGNRGFTQAPVVRDIDTAIAWIGEQRL